LVSLGRQTGRSRIVSLELPNQAVFPRLIPLPAPDQFGVRSLEQIFNRKRPRLTIFQNGGIGIDLTGDSGPPRAADFRLRPSVEVTGARNLRLEFSSSNFFQKFLLEREMVFA
jgi:hypothetical protein